MSSQMSFQLLVDLSFGLSLRMSLVVLPLQIIFSLYDISWEFYFLKIFFFFALCWLVLERLSFYGVRKYGCNAEVLGLHLWKIIVPLCEVVGKEKSLMYVNLCDCEVRVWCWNLKLTVKSPQFILLFLEKRFL